MNGTVEDILQREQLTYYIYYIHSQSLEPLLVQITSTSRFLKSEKSTSANMVLCI